MSVPSMVHRSGDTLVVRSLVSGDALFGSSVDAADDDEAHHRYTDDDDAKRLPDCKVKRNYTCAGPECDFFTQNPRVYLYHLRDVHGEKVRIYECPSCLYASRHYQKLLRHSKMVHGSSEGVEPRTRKRTPPVEDEPQAQPDEHLDEEPETTAVFKCSVCDFTGRTQAQLARHEREEHIKTKFFRCCKCTYVTHIKARYTKHVKYHSMPMIKCDMCDFRTPYKWNLDRHCKNHNGHGAFRCSACNFTADIKQSLTVHEMNHHVPPVGQAAGLGVGRRRNKVGASDATAAEEAAQQHQHQVGPVKSEPTEQVEEKKPKLKTPAKKVKVEVGESTKPFGGSDFIHPDDFVHHANGKVYIKNKCKQCNYKSAWDTEMAKHEKKVHNIHRDREETKQVKKPPRPIPNLIPIPSQTSVLKQSIKPPVYPVLKTAPELPEPSEPTMSQKDINDICAKSGNSVLKDFASLFGSEDVFKASTPKVPDLIPAAVYNSSAPKSKLDVFKQKHASFFDNLREKLELGAGGSCNLVCSLCGHESKCLTEQVKHQKTCGKETSRIRNLIPLHNISSSRCQFCRQRCKSSTDLYNHLQTCPEALKLDQVLDLKVEQVDIKEEMDTSSEHEGELRIDEDQSAEESEMKPHPMENKVFVWNDIMVPMDIEVDDSNYEYTDEKVDDNVSLDLSVRTHSPIGSESSYLGPEMTTPTPTVHHSPLPATEKIPTHGNDISVAQHKRVFKCPHCTFWASTASRFHVHIVGHLNKKPFECSLCAYRSNWRWDITKHIKLKSVRDQAHEQAKVLMTDETGRRNYTKYNKYLTEIPVSSDQSMDTSGGCGTRPKHHHDRNNSPSTSSRSELPKLPRAPTSSDFSPLLKRSPSRSKGDATTTTTARIQEKKRPSTEGKKTLFKCKKCNFRDASRDILLQHVKGHYQQAGGGVPSSAAAAAATAAAHRDSSLRGTSPDKDEASVNNITGKGGGAPFRCGHCNQVSNWKHVIQRHCRLKHSGDVRVVSNKNGQERIEVEEQPDEPDHIDVSQDGVFKCTSCPFSTDGDWEFERHRSGHAPTAESVLKCHYCNFFVSRKEDLADHLKLHGVTDPDDFLLRITERGEGDGKKFRCMVCPYVTNSKSQYTYHRQFHRPRGGQYTCTQCSYNVSKRHLLHQHLKVHGINVTSHKQNGEAIYLDELTDEIEEVPSSIVPQLSFDAQSFADIPLVWVSKNGKFSKMFKCRYCPHVNLRKVNIQEHEKMHSIREKNPNSSRVNDIEHRCTECNYVCNNAGVLSSHSKVHQGLYGSVHGLVDPTRTDEDQIRDLSRNVSAGSATPDEDDFEIVEPTVTESEDVEAESVLYFCKECPARFLKENEFGIHKRFHGSRLFYKCDYCTYTAREKPHLYSHSKVHTNEYQDRTKVLQSMYATSGNHPQPHTFPLKPGVDAAWVVVENSNKALEMSTLCSILNKPVKSSQNVPLSGTELFLQKSEAQQKQVQAQVEAAQKPVDPQFGVLMHGNPAFIYPTYLKNGRVKEKRYKCHKCPSAFDKREQYKVHLGLHGSQQRYCCDHCDYSVKYFANYAQHLKKHQLNADAHAARRSSDDADLDVDESAEVTSEVTPDEYPSKLTVADQQMLALMEQQRSPSKDLEEKKTFWCPSCPYTNARKDAVDNHQRRHVTVSGVRCTYTCEHCDYSVPQSHFLREHTKLHFTPNKANQVEGFMSCDNIKLTSSKTDEEADGKSLIFEERGSKFEERQFCPPLGADVAERFNNNEGEKQFINVQTGEVVSRKETSDTQSSAHQAEDGHMEVI